MITIFEKNTTSFKGLGLGALLPSSCVITEELNGGFELKMEHPYDPYGKWERIQMDRILYAPTPRGLEPFRIYKVKPAMKGIAVNARHIFYDLQDNLCLMVEYTGNAKGAISHLVSRFSYAMPFSFSTNLTTSGTLYGEFINPIQALLSENDDVDSFVKVYGGELLRQGFSVSMLDSIGEDRGVTIRYGKNLLGLEVDEDISELKTRIIIRNDAETEIVRDSPYINEYLYPKLYIVDGGDAAKNEMESMAAALLAEGIDRPKLNIRVDFQTLSKTEEYRGCGYAVLEEVQLGDTVTVIHEKMKFSQARKVIAYDWDAVLEKYTSVELGDTLPSLSATTNRLRQLMKSQKGKIVEIEVSIDGIRTLVANTKNDLSSQITQTAGEIRLEVANTKNNLSSQITQTAGEIRLEVADTKNDLSTQITQTAGKIWMELEGSEESPDTGLKDRMTKVEATADGLSVQVYGKYENGELVQSGLTQRADAIELTVNGEDGNSGLKLTADLLSSAVFDRYGNSRIQQTADEISLVVSGVDDYGKVVLTEDFLGVVADNVVINADVDLYGEMTVYTTDKLEYEGGTFGYMYGDDPFNASTKGIGIKAESGDCYVVAHNSGVSMVAEVYGAFLYYYDGNFMPTEDGEQMMGDPDFRWQGVYAKNGTIQTSDRRRKKDIEYNMAKYEAFFKKLKPTQYKMIDGESDRYHIGFISQDVEEELAECGLDSKDFAGFIKTPKRAVRDNADSEILDHHYSLRYDEFVALNTHMIQKLMKRVEELEKKMEGGDSSEN